MAKSTKLDRSIDEGIALNILRQNPGGLSGTEVGYKAGFVHNSARRAAMARACERLVRRGLVTREVRREFDRQTSARSSWYFGGAGSMVRQRAYYKAT